MARWLALACILCLSASTCAGEPLLKAPDGFRVELILQAPDIEAPTALCVASNGDVYFAEDPMDMRGPPTKNLDKIWLLKGGDPKKKILFAENMWAVMGLEVVRDRLYVVHAPHVTVFTLDEEGKARKREELFDELGPKVAGLPSFNDHIPSGIRMGMDGWLYVSIGDKGIPRMSRIPMPLRGTAQGKAMEGIGSVHVAEGRWRHAKEGHYISLEGGGVIRFRPDGSGLEVFASGTRNHLDVPMDEHDRIFVRDNTDDGLGWNTRLMYLPRGAFMGYPWAYTQRPTECLPMIHDFGGGSPCGGWVYCDDGLPETYRGRIFHCEWGQGKVYAVKVAPDGAGFKYVDQITFLDPAGVKDFRPFTLRPTADGTGFFVTDWGFSGWLQNVKAGRLWKVTYIKNDVKPMPRGKDTDSVEQLIKALDHPAHIERLRAQRNLLEKGKQALTEVYKALDDDRTSAKAKCHLLWIASSTMEGLTHVARATNPGTFEIQYEAIRALGNGEFKDESSSKDQGPNHAVNVIGALRKATLNCIGDQNLNPQVRYEAAIPVYWALNPSGLLNALDNERDRFVRFALQKTLKSKSAFGNAPLLAMISSELNSEVQRKLPIIEGLCLAIGDDYELRSIGLLRQFLQNTSPHVRARAVEVLGRLYFDRKLYAGGWWGTQPAAQKPPARDVAWEGTPIVRKALLEALKDKDADVRKAVLAGLIAARDPETLDPLTQQYALEKDPGSREGIVSAVAALASPNAGNFLLSVLRDKHSNSTLRAEALKGLEKDSRPIISDAIAAIATDSESAALQAAALLTLGRMKARQTKPACAVCLKSNKKEVRRGAIQALAELGELGDPSAAALVIPMLQDADREVRKAAIQSLGRFKNHDAVPGLLKLLADDDIQFDVLKALVQMPDRRAVSAYLAGLTSKNSGLREGSHRAFVVIGEDAVPILEQLAKRNELPSSALGELRAIYSSYAPISNWRLVGPFPADGKEYPPQKEQNFDAEYRVGDQIVKWKPHEANLKMHGHVDLERLFTPNQNVVAYGYAEVNSNTERDAQFLVGSDDTITIWLNGKKVHEFAGDRGWAFDQDKVNVHLQKGVNRILIQCGNHAGPWAFSLAVTGEIDKYPFLQGGAQKTDLEAFRTHARNNAGDALRGQKLFLDLKGLACVKCHAVGGQGGQVGPDLAGIGLKYKREDLMTSILEPSKTIAQGYETIVITTAKGITITGVFKGESADFVNVADAEGKMHAVRKEDIDERSFSPVSTMPNGISDGMTLQDFADIIAYLEARREDKITPKK